jgi:microcystin-dependent protein
MSTCSNCYNGCTEIVSDRCVKYTGIDVPVLGIKTGDSLSFVEQALITFLVSTLDGTGVKIDLAPVVVCDLVKQYLPTCKDLSIVDISKALVQAACNLQLQVNAINVTLATLNADYTIGCLTGVTSSSDTHAIVQAVINKLCQVQVDLTALALDLSTNYVTYAELPTLIQQYIENTPGSNLISNRMVPYAVVEYYGPRTFFDGTGKGTGDWDKIYLCNGLNGTPDKRGVVGVGVTDGTMLGLAMPAATNPSLGNPLYSISSTIVGSNNVVLSKLQMPNHTHVPTVAFNDPKHRHKFSDDTTGATNPLRATNDIIPQGTAPYPNAQISADGTGSGQIYLTSLESTGITVGVTIGNEGGGQAHANFQPGLGCLYIQYRP